jgi:hypothetical protein
VGRRCAAGPIERRSTWVPRCVARPTSGRPCSCGCRPCAAGPSGRRSCPKAVRGPRGERGVRVATRPLPRCVQRPTLRRIGLCPSRFWRSARRPCSSCCACRWAWPVDPSRRRHRFRRIGPGEQNLRCRHWSGCCCHLLLHRPVKRRRSARTVDPSRPGSPGRRQRVERGAQSRPTAPRRRGDSAGRSSAASGDSRGRGCVHPGGAPDVMRGGHDDAGSGTRRRSRWSSSNITRAATTTPINSVDRPTPRPLAAVSKPGASRQCPSGASGATGGGGPSTGPRTYETPSSRSSEGVS